MHFQFTFQKPSDIEKGAKLIGIADFWRKVKAEMANGQSCEDVKAQLGKIACRRNQIVHEADLVLKTSAKQITQRDIEFKDVSEDVAWLGEFVQSLNQVFYP